jgi:hypothetical protein
MVCGGVAARAGGAGGEARARVGVGAARGCALRCAALRAAQAAARTRRDLKDSCGATRARHAACAPRRAAPRPRVRVRAAAAGGPGVRARRVLRRAPRGLALTLPSHTTAPGPTRASRPLKSAQISGREPRLNVPECPHAARVVRHVTHPVPRFAAHAPGAHAPLTTTSCRFRAAAVLLCRAAVAFGCGVCVLQTDALTPKK